MNNEVPPSAEQEKLINQSEVTKVLKEQGLSPEGLAILNQWLDIEQARVEAGEITNLKLNVMWADVYRDAGLTENAIEAYEQAEEEAGYEGRSDMVEICQAEIKRLQAK